VLQSLTVKEQTLSLGMLTYHFQVEYMTFIVCLLVLSLIGSSWVRNICIYFVSVDNNTKLVLMLEIFQYDGEKFFKVGYCIYNTTSVL